MAETGAKGGSPKVHVNAVFNGSEDNRSNSVQKAANITFMLESVKNWYCEQLRLKELGKYILNSKNEEKFKELTKKIMKKNLSQEETSFYESHKHIIAECENLKAADGEIKALSKKHNQSISKAKEEAQGKQDKEQQKQEEKNVCPYCGKVHTDRAEIKEENKPVPPRDTPKYNCSIGSFNVNTKENSNYTPDFFSVNLQSQKHHMISYQRYVEAVGTRKLGDKVDFHINNGWGGDGSNGIELPAVNPKFANGNSWKNCSEDDKNYIVSKYMEGTKRQWHVGDHSGIYDKYYLPYEKCVTSRLIEIEEKTIKKNESKCKESENNDDIRAELNRLMSDIRNDLKDFKPKSEGGKTPIFFVSQRAYNYHYGLSSTIFEKDEVVLEKMKNLFGKKADDFIKDFNL